MEAAYFVAQNRYLQTQAVQLSNSIAPAEYCAALYHISFNANCICLEVVTVEVIWPAPPLPGGAASEAPVLSKTAVLSTGGEKFGWLKTLKNSTLNCTLKFSDTLLNFIFLNRDTSKLISPGPFN